MRGQRRRRWPSIEAMSAQKPPVSRASCPHLVPLCHLPLSQPSEPRYVQMTSQFPHCR